MVCIDLVTSLCIDLCVLQPSLFSYLGIILQLYCIIRLGPGKKEGNSDFLLSDFVEEVCIGEGKKRRLISTPFFISY